MPSLRSLYESALRDVAFNHFNEIDIRLLLCSIQGLNSMSDFYLRSDEEIADLQLFRSHFARLLNGEPVQYIINKASFLGDDYYVDSRVLIPRMETEEVVRFAEKRIAEVFMNKDISIVDIGTGSGIIAIALKKKYPYAKILASDISQDALDVAAINVAAHKANVDLLHGSALDPLLSHGYKVDVLISNPPYITNVSEIDKNVSDYEPRGALVDSSNQLIYQTILANYRYVAKYPFLIIFEIGYDMREKVEDLIKRFVPSAKWEIIKDINQKDRILSILIEQE